MFRLALALGMTVAELGERMDSREFSEWMAYYKMEPFGQDRGDIGHAITASVVANANAPKGKKFTPMDFLPRRKQKKRQMTEQEMRRIFDHAAKSWGKTNGSNRRN